MKIGVVNTINPISVSEQARYLAERIGGDLIRGIDPNALYDVLVIMGPPNIVFENIAKSGGSNTNIVAFARLKAYLRESYEDILDIVGRYYYPDIWHEFDNGGYRIPSIFMDLYTQPQNAR
jgi:hypothetical protein